MKIVGELQLDDIPPLAVPETPADLPGFISAGIPPLARELDARLPRAYEYARLTPHPTPPTGTAAVMTLLAGWSPLDDSYEDIRRPEYVYAAHEVIRATLGQALHTPHEGPGVLQAYRLWSDPRHRARIPHAEQWDATLRSGHPQPFSAQLPWDALPDPVPAPDDTPRAADPISDLLWADHQGGRWSRDDPEGRGQRRRWAQHRKVLAAEAVPYAADWASWANTLLEVVNTEAKAIAAAITPTPPSRSSWAR